MSIRKCFITLLVFLSTLGAASARKTENVVIVTWDGFRWQELFGGANQAMMNSKGAGGHPEPLLLKAKYDRPTPEERRELLLPFFWSTIAKQGQVFGDMSRNAPAQVTNGLKFSYPGYNEIFCGYGDPRIDSNDKKNNPNISVLEFLDGKPAFKGKVAALATWDVFPSIFRASESGIPVLSSWNPMKLEPLGEHGRNMNLMIDSLPHYWPGNTFDSIYIEATWEYLPRFMPRVLFVGLGETDEWGHARRYDLYLDAAKKSDRFVQDLWNKLQSMDQYKDKTTLILTTDHGRGGSGADWTSHGKDVEGAEFMWIAVMGPDTPALGVRENVSVTQSQVGGTIAALLGEDFKTVQPLAADPLPGVGCDK